LRRQTFMFTKNSILRTGLMVALGIMLVPLLAACGSSSSTSTSTGPVTLTFWSWVPNLQNEVDLFEKSHPNIKVKLENGGQSAAEYTKLQTALKAGSGAPDVVQLEYSHIPEFVLTGKLVDMSKYGASSVKNDYVPWVWGQVTQSSKIYAIPQDSGPMALLYRTDIFKKYNLTVPTTWAQYEQDAVTLHQDNPKISMADFPANDPAQMEALMAQAGSQPFQVNGSNLTVSLDNAPSEKVASYWNNLVQNKLVSTTPDFTNDWYAGLSNGSYATWPTAAWAPSFLTGAAAKSSGKWAAAPLPQWSATGTPVSANWGGSGDAVTTQSQHPQQATEFAEWLNHDQSSTIMMANKQFLFPTDSTTLNNPVIDTPQAFYAGQKVDSVFIAASKQINTGYQWSPIESYVDNQLENELGTSVDGKITLTQALQNLQKSTVSYAKSQGFTVK
jgi:multiple sugar transport system substrate-binding protein